MAVWTAWTGIVYHRTTTTRRALLSFLAADFAVGAAAVLSTGLVDTRARIEAGALTLPTVWSAAPVIAVAIALGWRGGVAAAALMGGADLLERGALESGPDPQRGPDGPHRRGGRLPHRAGPHRRAHPGPGPASGSRHARAPAPGPRHPRRRAAGAGAGAAARRGDRRREPRPGPDGRGAGVALRSLVTAGTRSRVPTVGGDPVDLAGPVRSARPAGRTPGDARRARRAGAAAQRGRARGRRSGGRRAGQRPRARRPGRRRPRSPRLDPGRGRGRRRRRDGPRRRSRHPRRPPGAGPPRRPPRRRALHPGPAARRRRHRRGGLRPGPGHGGRDARAAPARAARRRPRRSI